MKNLLNNKNKAINHLIWYSIGSFVPLLVGFIRTPIFTRYFTPAEYGYYGLIFITYSVFSIFLYSWLTNCVWRFYNYYKKESKLEDFYSNLSILYLLFTVVFLLITIVWNAASAELITNRLTVLIFIQLLLSSPIGYIVVVYRYELKSEKYNIIQIVRAVLSFAVQYALTFGMHFRVETIPISAIIIDIVVLAIILPPFIKKGLIKLSRYSKEVIKNLFSYAIPGIVTNLMFLVLISSDRYMIAWFCTIEEVGIYNQVYNLSQVSIMALVNVFFSVINPVFMREMELNFKSTIQLTQNFANVFILLLLPLTTCFSLFAPQLAIILLGKEFQTGNDIIPWVMFSSFIYGLTLFNENRLKMSSHYKPIVAGFISSASLNIILNLIFLPYYGYKFAAVTTLISYIFLFIFFLLMDIKLNKFYISGMYKLTPLLTLTVIQVIFVLVVQTMFDLKDNLTWMVIEVAVFFILYLPLLFLFNRNEIKLLLNSVNK